MSKKFDPQQPAGRIAFDERGNAVWQWRTENGDFKADVDTRTVKALQDASDAKLGAGAPPNPNDSNHNPYSTVDNPRAPQRGPRRTLDDMRKLSEEIKRSRAEGSKKP
jgi:hypothetical protein